MIKEFKCPNVRGKFGSRAMQKMSLTFQLYKSTHYENMPIQIYWKFYHQKMKIFR